MTEKTALMGNYARASLSFSHGEGSWLIAHSGDRYLDCASGIAVTTLGHGHPRLVEALSDQAQKLWHVSNLFTIPEQEEVAKLLTECAGLDKVFFCNSGTEATEAAVKMARRAIYHHSKISGLEPSRQTILCSEGAFHGRTIAMLAATDKPIFREGFGPMPEGFDHFPFGNMNVLRDRLTRDAESPAPQIAAVMIETVQGEGGAKPLPPRFIDDLSVLCHETGCLLIADEVQIGVGRSGYFFSYQESSAKPDIIAVAKGLAGGFPAGAVIATDYVAEAMTPGSHGSTFGGNPLAMRAAKAVISVLDEKFLADVRARAQHLFDALENLASRHPAITEIRGKGFLLGLVLSSDYPVAGITARLRDNHLLVVPAANNTIRLLPPLTITKNEIDQAVEILDKTIIETNT